MQELQKLPVSFKLFGKDSDDCVGLAMYQDVHGVTSISVMPLALVGDVDVMANAICNYAEDIVRFTGQEAAEFAMLLNEGEPKVVMLSENVPPDTRNVIRDFCAQCGSTQKRQDHANQ